jgi:hypothetical protein
MSAYDHCFDGGMAWDLTADIMEKLDNMDHSIMILMMPLPILYFPPPPPLRRRRAVRFFPSTEVIEVE